eukprot:Nk52_evm50s270 gene=Nk52_evmTU50s270
MIPDNTHQGSRKNFVRPHPAKAVRKDIEMDNDYDEDDRMLLEFATQAQDYMMEDACDMKESSKIVAEEEPDLPEAAMEEVEEPKPEKAEETELKKTEDANQEQVEETKRKEVKVDEKCEDSVKEALPPKKQSSSRFHCDIFDSLDGPRTEKETNEKEQEQKVAEIDKLEAGVLECIHELKNAFPEVPTEHLFHAMYVCSGVYKQAKYYIQHGTLSSGDPAWSRKEDEALLTATDDNTIASIREKRGNSSKPILQRTRFLNN